MVTVSAATCTVQNEETQIEAATKMLNNLVTGKHLKVAATAFDSS